MTDRTIRVLERAVSAGDDSAKPTLARLLARTQNADAGQRTIVLEQVRLARIGRVWTWLWNNGSPRIDGLYWPASTTDTHDDDIAMLANWNDKTAAVRAHGPVEMVTASYQVHGKPYLVPRHGWCVNPAGGYRSETTDDTPSRAMRVLEALGVECLCSDEYLRCECGRAFSTEPDSHDWSMPGWVGDGDYMCDRCLADVACPTCDNPADSGQCDRQSTEDDECSYQEPHECHCRCNDPEWRAQEFGE